jgi:hypothetical protein
VIRSYVWCASLGWVLAFGLGCAERNVAASHEGTLPQSPSDRAIRLAIKETQGLKAGAVRPSRVRTVLVFFPAGRFPAEYEFTSETTQLSGAVVHEPASPFVKVVVSPTIAREVTPQDRENGAALARKIWDNVRRLAAGEAATTRRHG